MKPWPMHDAFTICWLNPWRRGCGQEGLRARCVSISARNAELVTRSCQQMLPRATSLTGEIAQAAMRLFDRRFALNFPYRSVGLSCSALTPDDAPVQLDFLGDEAQAHQNRAAGKRHRRAASPLRASDRAPGGSAHRRAIRADQPERRAYGASRAVFTRGKEEKTLWRQRTEGRKTRASAM